MMSEKEMIPLRCCPNTEDMTCYVDGLLSAGKKKALECHIALCQECQEAIGVLKDVAARQKKETLIPVPRDVTERAKALMSAKAGLNLLDVVVEFSDKVFESLKATGDILLGPRLQPAYQLRGSKEEKAQTLIITKKFDHIKMEVEITRQQDNMNTITLKARDVSSGTAVSDLRATLMQGDSELESYVTLKGKAIFEQVTPGEYTIEISKPQKAFGKISFQLTKV